MNFRLFGLALSLAGITLAAAEPVPAKAKQLLTSPELAGWEAVAAEPVTVAKMARLRADGVLAVAGKPVGYLVTKEAFRNYRLHLEYRWSGKGGNSGILVHISPGPVDRVWPTCFQVQMKVGRVGDLLPMAAAKCAELIPTEQVKQRDRLAADSEKPVGEWNVCEVVCRDGRLDCLVNGVLQTRVTGCSPEAGRVGVQLEGVPYELRAVWIEPLD